MFEIVCIGIHVRFFLSHALHAHRSPRDREQDGNQTSIGYNKLTILTLQGQLGGWWNALTGASKNKNLSKVRRGGPWSREYELYYSLIEEEKVTPIDDTEAIKHQTNIESRAEKVSQSSAVISFHLISYNLLVEQLRMHDLKRVNPAVAQGRDSNINQQRCLYLRTTVKLNIIDCYVCVWSFVFFFWAGKLFHPYDKVAMKANIMCRNNRKLNSSCTQSNLHEPGKIQN